MTISFADDGNFQAATYSEGGVTVSGSNTLNFTDSLLFAGVSVIGGNDDFVDGAEHLLFFADDNTQFAEFSIAASRFDGNNGLFDGYEVEAFDTTGTSLGSFSDFQDGGIDLDRTDFVSLLGLTEAKSFQISAAGDAFKVGSLTFSVVPEPNAVTILLAFGASLALGRKRKNV